MRCILLATIFAAGLSTALLAQVQTILNPSLPALPQTEKSVGNPDATYCRPPQQQPDSRLPGPRVCMTNRQWNALRAQGLDISADGKSTVACRRYSTTDMVCTKGETP